MEADAFDEDDDVTRIFQPEALGNAKAYTVRLRDGSTETLNGYEIEAQLRAGVLSPSTAVAAEGTADWKLVSGLPEFGDAVEAYASEGSIPPAPRPMSSAPPPPPPVSIQAGMGGGMGGPYAGAKSSLPPPPPPGARPMPSSLPPPPPPPVERAAFGGAVSSLPAPPSSSVIVAGQMGGPPSMAVPVSSADLGPLRPGGSASTAPVSMYPGMEDEGFRGNRKTGWLVFAGVFFVMLIGWLVMQVHTLQQKVSTGEATAAVQHLPEGSAADTEGSKQEGKDSAKADETASSDTAEADKPSDALAANALDPSDLQKAPEEETDEEEEPPTTSVRSTQRSLYPRKTSAARSTKTTSTAKSASKTTKSSAPATKSVSSSAGGEFDVGAVKSGLARASMAASGCGKGESGSGKVRVLFANNGSVQNASLLSATFGSSVAQCVLAKFRGIKIPAYGGKQRAVSKSITVN